MTNKISSLDIRIAVLAYPLVSKEDNTYSAPVRKPLVPHAGDERIVSLFQSSPKPLINLPRSKIPPLLRKGQFIVLRLVEILKAALQKKERSHVLADIVPPRRLLVPQLPHPPFRSTKPSRFFWHPAYTPIQDGYAPACLMSEAKEDLPATVFNSAPVCAYARSALPRKGIVKQDADGFVYLELSDAFLTELFPLIEDTKILMPSSAHIPLILPHEWEQKKGWGDLTLGQVLNFEISRLCSLRPKEWPGVEKVYFFNLKSPELEKIREQFMLPSRIRGHDFHAAIGIKKGENKSKETFRLNVSCFAA